MTYAAGWTDGPTAALHARTGSTPTPCTLLLTVLPDSLPPVVDITPYRAVWTITHATLTNSGSPYPGRHRHSCQDYLPAGWLYPVPCSLPRLYYSVAYAAPNAYSCRPAAATLDSTGSVCYIFTPVDNV